MCMMKSRMAGPVLRPTATIPLNKCTKNYDVIGERCYWQTGKILFFDTVTGGENWTNPESKLKTLSNFRTRVEKWWLLYFGAKRVSFCLKSWNMGQQLHLTCTLKYETCNPKSLARETTAKNIHHDNARTHIAALTKKKIPDLFWEHLNHPSYSPHFASRIYNDEEFNSQAASFYAESLKKLMKCYEMFLSWIAIIRKTIVGI